MSAEIVTMLGVGGTLLASGGTFALFLLRLIGRLEDNFGRLQDRFDRLEEKVDELARDHQALAREFSEFRGEVRARLVDLPVGSAAR
ncbi:MAG: hypothetical protein OXI22_11020 [Defluviicoccus sp.]|nr:hypothetical protein [Defluviicoccus sp.]MDE0384405.1 hypothetical protein [Defluviicoccus sp.]